MILSVWNILACQKLKNVETCIASSSKELSAAWFSREPQCVAALQAGSPLKEVGSFVLALKIEWPKSLPIPL